MILDWLQKQNTVLIIIEKGKKGKNEINNESNTYSFVTEVNIYQFKAKDSEWRDYPMCLGNISKDFSDDNMK